MAGSSSMCGRFVIFRSFAAFVVLIFAWCGFAESDQNLKILSNLENLTESLSSMEENITSNPVQIAFLKRTRQTLQSHAKPDAPKTISTPQERGGKALLPEAEYKIARKKHDAARPATQILSQTVSIPTAEFQELQRASQTRSQDIENQTAAFPSLSSAPRCENGVDMGSRRRFWAYHDGKRQLLTIAVRVFRFHEFMFPGLNVI
jgi:hypothetical protein